MLVCQSRVILYQVYLKVYGFLSITIRQLDYPPVTVGSEQLWQSVTLLKPVGKDYLAFFQGPFCTAGRNNENGSVLKRMGIAP